MDFYFFPKIYSVDDAVCENIRKIIKKSLYAYKIICVLFEWVNDFFFDIAIINDRVLFIRVDR